MFFTLSLTFFFQIETLQREGHIRWADGFIFVYAINDRQSFEEIVKLKDHLDDVKKTNVQCVLVGNKVDLMRERDVSTAEGMKLATDMACAFFETSVCEGSEEIYELFYEVAREVKRRKLIETKSRRRSSAAQVKQVFTKMFNPNKQTNRQSSMWYTLFILWIPFQSARIDRILFEPPYH